LQPCGFAAIITIVRNTLSLHDNMTGFFRHIRLVMLLGACMLFGACNAPDPPPRNIPTSPAVLEITPAPTLDIDATATFYANMIRPTPTPAGLYIVQQDDTLSGLADRFDTTVEEIMVANEITDPGAILQIGQTLIIPSLAEEPLIGASPVTGSPVITNTITATDGVSRTDVVSPPVLLEEPTL
jgi:LysM repeat protein